MLYSTQKNHQQNEEEEKNHRKFKIIALHRNCFVWANLISKKRDKTKKIRHFGEYVSVRP